MSHFTRMKTRIVKKEYLVKALSDLNFKVREGSVHIRGFGGQQTAVEVMAPTGNPGYDIGFLKTGDTYEMVADWYGIKDIQPQQLLNQVQQRYAYHAVMERMAQQGFEVVEEQSREDRTIHLTVRRAVF
ncbi:DUF1257 domain-containing protein [Desulfococcus sp.]|uniref:DUF1257 domain-containing protein n=1 Tax=Desulfococcus sp. TaxID=2025834 RepID=UPI003593FFEF